MKKAVIAVKLKMFALLFIFAAAVALATSGTLAFFTDSKESTGIFTAGNVYIELTEAAVKTDSAGNLIEDTTKPRVAGAEVDGNQPVIHDYGCVYPGQTIYKDPTIKNTGVDTAWVAAKIIIEDGAGDIHKLYGYKGFDEIDITELLKGGLLGENVNVGTWNGYEDVCYNENFAMVQIANRDAGKYEFIFYIQKPLYSEQSVQIFNTLLIDPTFGNTEMQEFRNLELTVQAFAVQQFGFADCFNAMRTAFAAHFGGATQ